MWNLGNIIIWGGGAGGGVVVIEGDQSLRECVYVSECLVPAKAGCGSSLLDLPDLEELLVLKN